MEPFRIPPALPAAAMKSYTISMPASTHWRPATCEEAGCTQFLNGWQTSVDESTDLGQKQAHYIRHDRTRRHTEGHHGLGMTVFTFEAGQACFGAHRVRTGRPERFIEHGGDWRGNPLGLPPRVHASPDNWVESFQENLDGIRTAHERG